MRLKNTSAYSPITLGENQVVPSNVQVLRVGKFNHPRYGAFEITRQTLSEMKSNFDNKVRGIDVAFDYFHESDKEASAWVNSLEIREDGNELWADVVWTPNAAKKLAERELRYFSPDFAFKWTDPETNTTFSNVLFGGGLTNRPFVKEMKAIVADEKQEENTMTDLEKLQKQVKELQAANVKLSEDGAAKDKQMEGMVPKPAPPAPEDDPASLKKQLADLQAKCSELQKNNEAMLAEKKKLEEDKKASDDAKQLAEKEKDFNVLLTEGKACAAQKDAFIKGDMSAFIKLAQPVNLKAQGTSQSDETVDADAAAIIKLAEEKQKANPKLDRGSAISQAKKELKK